MPVQNLRFVSRSSGFEATYAVTVNVSELSPGGTQGGLVVSRTFERAVRMPDYAATQNPTGFDRAVESIAVPPGRYTVTVAVEDGVSGRSVSREVGHVVRPMAAGGGRIAAMSDPILLDRYDADARTFEPNVGAAISTEQDAFTVYYELYADAPESLRVTYAVTEQNRVRERPSFSALLGLAPRQQADLGTPVAFSEDLDLPAGRTPAAFRIETERLQVGDYALTVRLETATGDLVAETTRPFSVRWMGLSGQIADLDLAISQLRYVARDRELNAIRQADTPEERTRLFRAFWDDAATLRRGRRATSAWRSTTTASPTPTSATRASATWAGTRTAARSTSASARRTSSRSTRSTTAPTRTRSGTTAGRAAASSSSTRAAWATSACSSPSGTTGRGCRGGQRAPAIRDRQRHFR